MKTCLVVALALAVVSLVVPGCTAETPDSPRTDASTPATPLSERSGSRLFDPHGNFVLYVSNQSFEIDPVDIVIEIDGDEIIDGDFEVGNQHNWKRYVLRLSPGRHTLSARSAAGEAVVEESFVVSQRRWAVLNYWYYSEAYGSPPEPKHLEFEIYDEPVRFD